MSVATHLAALQRLAWLREQELERRRRALAEQRLLRERFQRNVDQLHGLAAGASGQGGARLPAALSLNAANYKQTVLQLAAAQREDLTRQDGEVAAAQHALGEAARQRAALDQMLAERLRRARRAQTVREQKQQDEMATLAWGRRPA